MLLKVASFYSKNDGLERGKIKNILERWAREGQAVFGRGGRLYFLEKNISVFVSLRGLL